LNAWLLLMLLLLLVLLLLLMLVLLMVLLLVVLRGQSLGHRTGSVLGNWILTEMRLEVRSGILRGARGGYFFIGGHLFITAIFFPFLVTAAVTRRASFLREKGGLSFGNDSLPNKRGGRMTAITPVLSA